MKSTEYSVVFFPFEKNLHQLHFTFTNQILFSVTLQHTWWPQTLWSGFLSCWLILQPFYQKWEVSLLGGPNWSADCKEHARHQKKQLFVFLITIYHEKEITRLKCYGTNSTNSGAKTLSLQNHWKFSGFAGPIIIKPRHSLVTIFIPYGL